MPHSCPRSFLNITTASINQAPDPKPASMDATREPRWLREALRSSILHDHVFSASQEGGRHGGNSQRDPAQLAYLRQLISALLEGRRLVATYNYVLLAILGVFTALHFRDRLVMSSWWRARRRSRPDRGHVASVLSGCSDQRTGTASSSSSSTIQGTATPPEPLKGEEELDGERRPLLGHSPAFGGTGSPSRSGPIAFVSSWLAYQPQPITVLNKTLPSNGTSLFVLSFLGLNVFYQFYKAPLAGNLMFAFADRAGCIFVANLPLLYLLATKNQPLKYLTGQSYEALNIFHRRVGELLCLEAAVHFGGMLAFQFFKPEWLMRGNIWEFLQHRLVLLGIGAFVCYELLYLSSLGSFRQRWYELFLASHIVLQISALVFLWLHYHTARPYVAASLAIFAVDRLVWRLVVKQTTLSADLIVLPDGDTVMLSANWDLSAAPRSQRGIKAGWKPTDHVFLTVPALGRTHALQAHPFTIASAAPSSAGIDGSGGVVATHAWFNLLIRAHSGFTRDLLHYAHRHTSVSVRLDGPYGSSHALDTLRAADDVILVAGGSGIAVTFPLAWALLMEQQQRQDDRERERGSSSALESGGEGKDIARRVRLLWIIHSDEHRYWVPGSLLDDLVAAGLDLVVPSPTAVAGRPDVQGHVQGWIGQADAGGRNARVLVSGPDGLNRVVRNSCSQALRRGADVRVVVEKFGW